MTMTDLAPVIFLVGSVAVFVNDAGASTAFPLRTGHSYVVERRSVVVSSYFLEIHSLGSNKKGGGADAPSMSQLRYYVRTLVPSTCPGC